MTWLVATLAAFAVYRAARMVAEEDGPFFLFKRLRDRFSDDKRSFDLGLHCFACLSFWIALLAALLLCWASGWDWYELPLWWLGLGGAAIKINEYWRR